MSEARSVEHELSEDQSRRLLLVHRRVPGNGPPRARLTQLSGFLSEIIGSKVALAGKRRSEWVVLAESVGEPRPFASGVAPAAFARVATDLRTDVVCWRQGASEWTLVGLPVDSDLPVILMISGDWTRSASALEQVGRALLVNGAASAPRTAVEVAHDLAQELVGVRGLGEVCGLALRHAVRFVPSRLAAFAVPMESGELSIVATVGYPLALVESLRIAPGTGVIGEVFRRGTPMVVADVRSSPGLSPKRSRYRTNSFAAVPVAAGGDVLGVLCATDRVGDTTFSERDVSDLRTLMVPVTLALGRERAERRAEASAHAAIVDPGSGLFNRPYFQTRLDEELQRSARQGTPVSLLMVDIDAFKSINDTYGHVAGDMVIRDVAEILRRSVRIFDVCTRYGGEEFAVMMPGSSLQSATMIAERIRRRIEAYHPPDRSLTDVRITVSIGVSESAVGSTARDVIERADGALYAAKRAGKNQVRTAGSGDQAQTD